MSTTADRAALVALASLPRMGPARLRALTAHDPPSRSLAAIVAGTVRPPPGDPLHDALSRGPDEPSALLRRWRTVAAGLDPAGLLARHRRAGVAVLAPDDADYPAALRHDPEPPSVLFVRGDPAVIPGDRVAVVGTRDCTRYGFDVARGFGTGLGGAGVRVVSGLALGCDAAAHRGALDAWAGHGAPPIGVVGSGLDIVYPPRNGRLWEEVASAGALLSEHPNGTRAAAWHFPARNRILAALSSAVVVVESHRKGGAIITAELALDRDRSVFVVPGPVTSPASTGALHLLAQGANVATGADDVLLGLGLVRARHPDAGPPLPSAAHGPDAPTDPADAALLDLIGAAPVSLSALLERTGNGLGPLTARLGRLEAAGWIAQRGGWIERAGGPPRPGEGIGHGPPEGSGEPA